MEKLRVASVIIQDGQGGIEVVSRINCNAEIIKINEFPKKGLISSQYGIIFKAIKVIKILKKYDVILTNLPLHHMVFSFFNLFFKKKLLCVEHGPWVHVISAKSSLLISWIYQFWLSKTSVKFICVSKDLYALYNLIRNNNIYIPNTISSINKLNNKQKKLNDKIKFVFVGRFDFQKDVQLAINSYIFYRDNYNKNCSLDLYGNGVELNNYKNNYKNNLGIRFNGYVSNISNKLINYDICIVTSRFEGLPGIILESLYSECKVVSTPFISGLMELNEYKGLFISNDREASSIAEEINYAVLRNVDTSYISETIEKKYSSDFVQMRYRKLIEKL